MTAHHWRFFRAGGFNQVRIEHGHDLLALEHLDQKLWVALACPVANIDFDRRTLHLLDKDGDGRVRAADLLAEAGWLKRVLKNPDELVRSGEDLHLSAIDENTPEGARILASARRILSNLGRPDAKSIMLADTLDTERIFAATRFNGDGVVPVAAADDDATKALIVDIMACMGSKMDRSGFPGVDQDGIDGFFAGVEAYAAWLDRDQGGEGADGIRAFAALRDKVDGFFLQCGIAAYNGESVSAVSPNFDVFSQLVNRTVEESLAVLRPLPIASINADAVLPLGVGVNPAWADSVAAFKDLVVVPQLGERTHLTAEEWRILCLRFADRLDWMAAKPNTPVSQLGDDRILAIRAAKAKPGLDALVAEDKALESEAAAIDEVERLIRMRIGFFRLANNFVSFREFYARENKAVFQAGTLYLDGRSADLCIRVGDAERHAKLATLSRIYLVYCDCFRKDRDDKITIAAAFTAGDSDQLKLGRNGVFYDRDGNDWDATIVKLVEHPISMRQSFWSPYKQLATFIQDQIEKVAAARAAQPQVQVVSVAAAPAPAAAPAKPATPAAPAAASTAAAQPQPAFDVGRFAGIFAAIGLALGAIGTAVASVVTGFLKLSWWEMPLAVAGLALVVSGPSMVIAYIKLRQRNLAPILDATGWAVNARALINIPFGGSLTAVAKLPKGAERSLVDPYAEKTAPWRLYAVMIAIAAVLGVSWWLGLLDKASAWKF